MIRAASPSMRESSLWRLKTSSGNRLHVPLPTKSGGIGTNIHEARGITCSQRASDSRRPILRLPARPPPETCHCTVVSPCMPDARGQRLTVSPLVSVNPPCHDHLLAPHPPPPWLRVASPVEEPELIIKLLLCDDLFSLGRRSSPPLVPALEFISLTVRAVDSPKKTGYPNRKGGRSVRSEARLSLAF